MRTPRRNAAKIQTLRQHGVLNPHPEGVTDPLFQTGEFFDPQDMVQVKYKMLRRVEVEKAPVTEAAATFGLSRPAFYQAQHAVAQQGLAGLIPRKRGPHGAHKLTPAVLDFVVQQRAVSPSLTTAELIMRIQQQFGVAVHRRTIERHLAPQEKNAPDTRQRRSSVECRSGGWLRAVAPPRTRWRTGRSGICSVAA
jgi:transposase